jgi:chromosome condensin MukBEF ATPase and DNA-binding subunit MukB
MERFMTLEGKKEELRRRIKRFMTRVPEKRAAQTSYEKVYNASAGKEGTQAS